MKIERLPAPDWSTDSCRNTADDAADDGVLDPYQLADDSREPAACTECGATYVDGVWQWKLPPPEARKIVCPACSRIHDKHAAGSLLIEGEFSREYHDEIGEIIQTLETRTKSENPMQRIMSIEERADGLLVRTTAIHLAKCIGERLHQVYRGNLDFHYNEADTLLRVRWQRWG